MDGKMFTPSLQAMPLFIFLLPLVLHPGVEAGGTGREANAVVESSSAFAIDLYRQVKSREGNVIVSPLSIYFAMGMVHLGARGKTAEELASALHIEQHRMLHVIGSGRLVNHINAIAGEPGVTLQLANRVWVRKNCEVLTDYQKGCWNCYGTRIGRIDFSNPVASSATINQWVSEQTGKRITTLITPDMIDPKLTRLMLVNALYFNGDWRRRFDEQDTRPRTFWLSPERKIDVPTMRQEEEFGYAETETAQILEMPYVGKNIEALFILPKEQCNLATVEEQLTAEQIGAWRKACRSRDIRVYLPRFKTEMSLDLIPLLQKLGIAEVLDDQTADLTGINTTEPLFLSHAVHKAGVEMTEWGAEAYAATADSIDWGGEREPAKPIIFRANHPFLFMIVARRSGAILFMGRMNDPRE